MSAIRYTTHAPAQAVLEFWLGDALELGWPSQDPGRLWFGGGAALDRDIDDRFGLLVQDAIAGGLTAWESGTFDRLALVILLDQFPRNLFRGQAQAFAGDMRAQSLVTDALAKSWDLQLPLAGRVFMYMPLEHAEVLALQQESVRRFATLVAAAAPQRLQDLQGNLKYAQMHHDIIARFGRFPHRNAVLGRASTGQEQEFLKDGPRFGQ